MQDDIRDCGKLISIFRVPNVEKIIFYFSFLFADEIVEQVKYYIFVFQRQNLYFCKTRKHTPHTKVLEPRNAYVSYFQVSKFSRTHCADYLRRG